MTRVTPFPLSPVTVKRLRADLTTQPFVTLTTASLTFVRWKSAARKFPHLLRRRKSLPPKSPSLLTTQKRLWSLRISIAPISRKERPEPLLQGQRDLNPLHSTFSNKEILTKNPFPSMQRSLSQAKRVKRFPTHKPRFRVLLILLQRTFQTTPKSAKCSVLIL